ncbi:hypothetical protein Leryth_006450 [Lithospermum erythrorhizon]|nr:hypothetical protein Leryth_006450 [Lithospermum erythrorhizon]
MEASLRLCSKVQSRGEIHVIVGPMFAGKTTALLRRVRSESNLGRKVVVIKSSKDTRYAVNSVVTHDGTKFPCWALPNLSNFKHKFGIDEYHKPKFVYWDMGAGGANCIICSITETTNLYLRRNFGSVLDVVPLADTVTKLTARCEVCGKKAIFTLRKIDDTQIELVGGADIYMPVCRKHYVNVAHPVANEAVETQKHPVEPLL